jgi:hypothetical protein
MDRMLFGDHLEQQENYLEEVKQFLAGMSGCHEDQSK